MENETKQTETPEVQNTAGLIENALKAAERLEAANAKQEELIKRQEMLSARAMLGGKTEAGFSEEKKEETPVEYKNRIMSGKL